MHGHGQPIYLNKGYPYKKNPPYVGGDNSWGARPHKQYMIWPGKHYFSVTLEPVRP